MKLKKSASILLAGLLLVGSVPAIPAAGPTASVLEVHGKRSVFVNSFGKTIYEGNTYGAYKTLSEGMKALGTEGGTVLLTGTGVAKNFTDIDGRGPITIEGIDSKASSCVVEILETPSIDLKGDLTLAFCNLHTGEDSVLYTNGFNFETADSFDTYHPHVSGAYTYLDPPSIAVGTVEAGKSAVVYLDAGTYTLLAAGSVNGKAVNGDTDVLLEGGNVAKVVAGNVGGGTMNGNATLSIGDGNVTDLIVGSEGGVINGNVTTVLGGGTYENVTLGAAEGATINGSVIVVANGGTIVNPIKAGAGTVTGKKIVVSANDVQLADGIADYIVKLSGGLCEPQTSGAEVTGFLFTDEYGIPAKNATINGSAVSSDNGVYQLSAGKNTVEVKTTLSIKLNRSAKYVAGYEDGTFLPQKNMTRAEAITLLTRLVTDEANFKGLVKSKYKDVAPGSWYESYIGLFQKLGFLDDIAADHGMNILPGQSITRGEFVELIYQISRLDATDSAIRMGEFTDVDNTTPHAKAINYAVSTGIVNGYEDGSFKPAGNITRAEVVTIVNRFVGREPTGNAGDTNFSDIGDHWAKGQILAACNAEGTSWTAKALDADKFELVGTSAEENIKALYEKSSTLSGDAIRAGSDLIAEQMKKNVLNSKDELPKKGPVYYVSEEKGDDNNDGLSPEKPFKTLTAVNSLKLVKTGTTVLFERGGIYRGTLNLMNGVSYGAYGEGPKPLLMQSAQNYADESLWKETKWPNIWQCTKKLTNVGVIGFDHDLFDYSDNTYNELYGTSCAVDYNGFKTAADLKNDLEFYSVYDSKPSYLYVYCSKGNPGSVYTDIEIGENFPILSGSASDVTLDNLAVKFTGNHGMSSYTTKNRVVTNCVFSWIGGSAFGAKGSVYGNAIQIYGGCDGFRVENCWTYQICDTGITHQKNYESTTIQTNIQYIGNLVEYDFWGIEVYNNPPTADQVKKVVKPPVIETSHVHTAYNILRYGGLGWGCVIRNRGGHMYSVNGLGDNFDELTEYNIFDTCNGYLISMDNSAKETMDKNFYIQRYGAMLGNLRGYARTCDYNAAARIREDLGDKNAVVIIF